MWFTIILIILLSLAILFSYLNRNTLGDWEPGAVICWILFVLMGLGYLINLGHNYSAVNSLKDTYTEYTYLVELSENNQNLTAEEREMAISDIRCYNINLAKLQGREKRNWQNWIIPNSIRTMPRIPYPTMPANPQQEIKLKLQNELE